jgi:hypothetical protein
MVEIGFIILRHVNSEITNKYWISCINSIRAFYPENKILIIDDNSNYNFITEEKLYKTTIINSEYPKRGELLPYYYYLHNKLFDIAVIIHDSTIINTYIDFNIDKYISLWNFGHSPNDQLDDETLMIKSFNNTELLNFYNNRSLWNGCYGGMSIITHDYLSYINSLYAIENLLPLILNRHNRMSFERVLGCIMAMHTEIKIAAKFGNIHKYCTWGLPFNTRDYFKHLPIFKYWCGR